MGTINGSSDPAARGGDERPKSPRERLAEKNQRLKRLREQLEAKNRELDGFKAKLHLVERGAEVTGIRPENMVWIFGYGRTGSTWLAAMMEEIKGHEVWFEPCVGELFGNLYYGPGRAGQRQSRHFVLGAQRETWLKPLRSFVLEVADARFPGLVSGGCLVIKEPHGSIGAPLLMEALPESRMILLVRDPRDMVASTLDAFKKGNWAFERTRDDGQDDGMATERPAEFVRSVAEQYMKNAGNATQAYENHTGPKTLVRYEDLRSDTLGVMRRAYSQLDIPVVEEALASAVEKHSWESIPRDKKGQGKFYRKATPGGWKEDLTLEQVRVVEEVTAPLLERFYPGTAARVTPGSSPGSA